MNYDAVVVGAGVLGLSTAYHIKLENPAEKVLLIDKNPGPGQGNSGKSAECFRNIFYSEINTLLADTSIDFFFHVQYEKGFDLGIRKVGYLFLTAEEELKLFKKEHIKKGQVKVYEREDLKKLLKLNLNVEKDKEAQMLNLKNIQKGFQIIKAGYLSVSKLIEFYESEFKRLGGETLYRTKVKKLLMKPKEELNIIGEPHIWQDAEVVGVETEKGKIYAKKTIVATGAWSNTLLHPVGLETYMNPKKRQLFVLKAKTKELKDLLYSKGFNKEGILPFTILPKPLIWMRATMEENTFWIGCADEIGRSFKLEDDPKPEKYFYIYGIRPVLEKYFPQFTNQEPLNLWAGQYAVNSYDGCPIVYEESGVIYLTSATDRGIQISPSLGKIASAVYFGEEYAELFGGRKFKVSDVGIRKRKIEYELVL